MPSYSASYPLCEGFYSRDSLSVRRQVVHWFFRCPCSNGRDVELALQEADAPSMPKHGEVMADGHAGQIVCRFAAVSVVRMEGGGHGTLGAHRREPRDDPV